MPNPTLTVDILLAGLTEAKTQLADLKATGTQAADGLTASLNQTNSAATDSADKARLLQANWETSLTNTGSRVDKLVSQLQELSRQDPKLDNSEMLAQLGQVQTRLDELKASPVTITGKADFAELNTQIATTKRNVQEMAGTAETEGAGGFNALKGSAVELFGQLALLQQGAQMVGQAFDATAGEAIKWQTELTNIQNNTTLSSASIVQLGQDSMQTAEALGGNLDDIATGYMKATNMAFNMADAQKIANAASESAISTGSDQASTIEVLASTMREYNLTGDQAAKTMDVLHNSAAQGNMTLEEFDAGGRRAISTAANLGDSLVDAASAFAALTQHGFDASAAGTQVTAMLTHIVEPSKEAEAEIQRLSQTTGIDLVGDFSQAGLQAKGLYGVLGDVKAAVGDDTSEVLKLIPALRGGQGALALVNEGAATFTTILQSNQAVMAGSYSPTAEAMARTQETLGNKTAVMGAKMHDLAIEIGQVMTPALSGLLDITTQTTTAENSFFDALNKLGTVKMINIADVGFVADANSVNQGIVDSVNQLTEALFPSKSQLDVAAARSAADQEKSMADFEARAKTSIDAATAAMQQETQAIASAGQNVAPVGLPVGILDGINADLDQLRTSVLSKLQDMSPAVYDKVLTLFDNGDLHGGLVAAAKVLGGDTVQSMVNETENKSQDDGPIVHDSVVGAFAGIDTTLAKMGADAGYGYVQNLANQFDKNQAALNARIKTYTSALDELQSTGDDTNPDQLRQEQNLQRNLKPLTQGTVAEAKLIDTSPYNPYADKANRQYYGQDTDAGKNAYGVSNSTANSASNSEAGQVATAAKIAADEATASLAPFNAQVQTAKTNLEAAKIALAGATSSIQPFKDGVDTAQVAVDGVQEKIRLATEALEPFQIAQRSATENVTQAQRALDLATQSLEPYQANVDKAQTSVTAAQHAIDDATQALQPYEVSVRSATEAVGAAQRELDVHTQGLKQYQDVVTADNDAIAGLDTQIRHVTEGLVPYQAAVTQADAALTKANANLKTAQDQLSGYQSQLQAAQSELRNFANAPLQGQQAFGDQLEQNQQHIDQLQYKLNQIKLTGVGSDGKASDAAAETADIQAQIDKLNLERQQLQLQNDMTIGAEQHRLADLANTTPEITGAQAEAGIAAAKANIASINNSIAQATANVLSQNMAQIAAQVAVDAANAALATQQQRLTLLNEQMTYEKNLLADDQDALAGATAQLRPYQAALDAANTSLANANYQLTLQKQALDPLYDQLANQQAILGAANWEYGQAQALLIPYNKALSDAKIVLADANYQLGQQQQKLDPLNDALQIANDKLGDAKTAYAEAQKTLDPYTKAVADAQTALDTANQALDDHKTAVDAVKQSYDDARISLEKYKAELKGIDSGGATSGSSTAPASTNSARATGNSAAAQTAYAYAGNTAQASSSGPQHIHVYLDGRELANSSARSTSEAQSRFQRQRHPE